MANSISASVSRKGVNRRVDVVTVQKLLKTNGFWAALGEEAKKRGLVWGGDWKSFRDVAHIQGRQNSELSLVKRESGL